MSELRDPTIEEFYKYCSERKLMAVRCIRCRQVMVPPRAICSNCRHSRVEWVELSQKGKLVTYTIVHVSPQQFKHMTPYAVGIVEMPEGVKIPSIIRTSRLEDLKIGMQLEADFSPRPQEGGWPNWPRYFFKETG
jgi:scaffold protein (connect acetoacetyl-CoA thiolase and HMG-CoA synthase)